ncbi:MAG TPA: tRNA (N6-threonylcarbamoyladenosine(37)-N6)-methyltransferase TrmO [Pararhodobacter sp.]|uniref:tRNA (N6-threonylcarbamoyladenosine(37)-N6)-methyltransferase TrmO n=1 Tax=Pararhodobacter sp. TaxID=2127056 RepID=UPI001E0F664C|nr:tRNA (N6-threonylcarbamoyladenosine(37)-N6)-methyltransferase TrmO [Pararhodobacter sp.]MCB1344430.1 tRNA (N6-threonylcarbamoyladenosine(37)-N6)-methyltransferase TrmO [Paracoccaceae bacterium]HPD92725.1 tRNA (N6-threonylcarbamoyladenosine(37)-N6)-methyltransferase TrmO [Pararhodobacter sp.]
MPDKPLKPNEIATEVPLGADATLGFIGHVETPWKTLRDCPKRAPLDGPESTVVLAAPWDRALDGVEGFDFLELFLWFHRARRDLLVIDPAHGGGPRGVFALRAPVRPNPIAVTTVALVARHGNRLIVRGLEALDGTPLIDIKPGRCPNAP